MIHRDIKRANVLVDGNGSPKLSDFGLARLLAGSAVLTGKDAIIGTAEYISPEQVLGAPADQRSDIYSLGVIVYQLLLGKLPFHGDTPTETLMAHVHQPVPLPTSVDPRFDPRLEAVILRALNKEPGDRYATATEMVEALESVSPREAPEAGLLAPPTAVEPAVDESLVEARPERRLSARLTLLLVFVGIAVGGTAGLALFALLDSPEEGGTKVAAPAVSAVNASSEGPDTPVPREGLSAAGPAEPEPGAVLSAIFERVQDIRGLQPLGRLVPRFMTSDALRGRLLEAERRQTRDVEREQALASVLGLISEDFDLVQLGLDSVDEPFKLGAGRAASYDREARERYVRDELAEISSFDDLEIFEEFEVVVGYAMPLLEQHFDIGDLEQGTEGSSDRQAAIEALIIGDASTVGQEHMSAHISPDRFVGAPPPERGPIVENSPEFAKRRALFAPQGGTNFIAALRKTGQWEAMRLVYKDPPVSTERIIHPESYLEGDEPVVVSLPDLVGALGSSWVEVHGGVMGESFLRAYLAELSRSGFSEAAAGCGGDRFSLLEGPSGERVLVALSVWDNPEDAGQFSTLVEENALGSVRATVSAAGNRVLLTVGRRRRSRRCGPSSTGSSWLCPSG